MSDDFRKRCASLHQKLLRDGILRQNDPVQTIMDFIRGELLESEEHRYLRCNICGFLIDTRYEATKPTITYTGAGRP